MNSGSYRILIGIQFLWALIILVGLLFMPESPRWYIKKGKNDKARKAFAQIYRLPEDEPFIDQEITLLEENHQEELESGSADAGYIDCFRGGVKRGSNLRRTSTGVGIQMFQQLSQSL